VVVTQQEGEPHLREWMSDLGVADRTDVIAIPNRTKLSIWAEDKFTMCTDNSGKRLLMHPFSDAHRGDAEAAKAVARSFGWEYVEVDHSFQSGNILAGTDFLLVGADSASGLPDLGTSCTLPKPNIIETRVPVPGFDQSFESRDIEIGGQPWRELCYRGNRAETKQPFFHIDGFLTIAGKGVDGRDRMLVGDPGMAAEALEMDLPDHSLRAAFDDIAAQLDDAGFCVVRNPLPLVFQDDHINKTRHWYFASANNALVEIDGAQKTVWLPTYGHGHWSALELTDRINEKVWQQLGFETRALGDFHQFALNLGSLRCITKCLVRSRMSTAC